MDQIELNIIHIRLMIDHKEQERVNQLFQEYDKIPELTKWWLKPYYELREENEYREVFNEYRDTREKEAKKKLLQMIQEHQLDKFTYYRFMEKCFNEQYYAAFSYCLHKMYNHIESGMLDQKGLGYAYRNINNEKDRIMLAPLNQQSLPVVDIDHNRIQIGNEYYQLELESNERLRQFKGNSICQSITIYSNRKVEMTLYTLVDSDLRVRHPNKIKIISKMRFTRQLL